jgi:hypothetical protein
MPTPQSVGGELPGSPVVYRLPVLDWNAISKPPVVSQLMLGLVPVIIAPTFQEPEWPHPTVYRLPWLDWNAIRGVLAFAWAPPVPTASSVAAAASTPASVRRTAPVS